MSGHTLAEKLIASHSVGMKDRELWPGDLVEVNVDIVLANDITAPISLREFEKLGVDKVFDPGQSRPGCRSLRPEQRHQIRRTVPENAGIRPAAGNSQPL